MKIEIPVRVSRSRRYAPPALLLAAPLLALLGCVASPADTSETTGDTSSPILKGTPVGEETPDAELTVEVLPPGVLCSGTVIFPGWVLTAAHCVNGYANFPGSITIHSMDGNASEGSVTTTADRIVVFPGYNATTHDGDAALVHVPVSLLADDHLFWEQRLMLGATQPGMPLTCFGWGPDVYGAQDFQLREASLSVRANTYSGYSLGVGANGQITIPGDSGGGCFWTSGGQRYQTGIHSYQTTSAGTPYVQSAYDQGMDELTYFIESTIGVSTTTDAGYPSMMRATADVNGDGVLDYCRFVGNPPGIFLACQLGMWNGSFDGKPLWYRPSPYEFQSMPGVDPGYPGTGYMSDVNGDGRADYCRTVGNPPSTFVSCDLATEWGFSWTQYWEPPIIKRKL